MTGEIGVVLTCSGEATVLSSGPLTNQRHERFCQEYLIDLNATKAYLRTGYDVSANVAGAAGSRLLSDVRIASRIAELQAERATRTQITADRVLAELAAVGFSNVAHYQIDDDGHVVTTPDAPETALRAVASIKRKKRVTRPKGGDPFEQIETEIRLWDKPATLRLAGQHLGLYRERVEHTGADGGPLQIEDVNASRERLAGRIAGIAARLGAERDPGGSHANGNGRP